MNFARVLYIQLSRLSITELNSWLITGFGAADGGEGVTDVGGIVDGQSGRQNDEDGGCDLYRQAPIVHQTQQIDQSECNAGEHPEDGNQIGYQNQCHADHCSHRQAQIPYEFVTNHLFHTKYQY